jgi:hypothetical protein
MTGHFRDREPLGRIASVGGGRLQHHLLVAAAGRQRQPGVTT